MVGKERKKPVRRKKASDAGSRGLPPADAQPGEPPAPVSALGRYIEENGGTVLASYRDPLGGHWQVLAVLPVEQVEPTPFQRDISEPHVGRLMRVLDSLDRFLDPIIAVRSDPAGENEKTRYWTPNGNHRLSAVKRLGGRSILALVLVETDLAYKILALNTERAHNLREKALEVIRMARDLAARDARPERDFALEFEEPAFLTLGACYEKNGRFAGGAYHPLLKRIDGFLDEPLPAAIRERARRAERVLALEDAVAAAMKALQEKGFQSPYLRPFVVARINPLRFQKGGAPEFDPTIDKMIASANKFNAESVKPEQLARAGGAPAGDE